MSCFAWVAPVSILAVSLLRGSPLLAQAVPIGSEFQVNTYATGDQYLPAVAAAGTGDFIVVWENFGRDGDENGIFGRRFDSTGTPFASEFQVNTHTTGPQIEPDVAADLDGDFVVVWESFYQDSSTSTGIFGQTFNSVGGTVGSEFQINQYTTGNQSNPAVAMDNSGSFVVVWEDRSGRYSMQYEIFGRRFSAGGSPVGSEFLVNTYTTGTQSYPDVAADADWDFIVVWESDGQDGNGQGIFGQRFSSTGAPAGSNFPVNTYTTGPQRFPSVTMDDDGNFVVVWESDGQDGDGRGIFAQIYASSGVPFGSEFQVNSYTTGLQRYPMVSSDDDGNFVVVWDTFGVDASSFSVVGRQFSSSGAGIGTEFLVNSYTTLLQGYPAVAVQATNRFVVTWQSEGQDSSQFGVFGQLFGPEVPTATETSTATPTDTATPTATATDTPTPTETPTPTFTPTITATNTFAPTSTSTPTGSATQTPTPTSTASVSPTATMTGTPSSTPTQGVLVPAPSPALSPWMMAVAVSVLAATGLLALTRARRGG